MTDDLIVSGYDDNSRKIKTALQGKKGVTDHMNKWGASRAIK